MKREVVICRSLQDKEYDTVDIWCLTGIHWDNVSGGKHKKQNGYSLYGYIPYGLLLKKNVACSGKHFCKYNLAKICIPAYRNQQKSYKDSYISLLKEAGVKPESPILRNRPKGQGPCTKKIMYCLSSVPFMKKEEVQEKMLWFGYKISTVNRAICYLKRINVICVVNNIYLKIVKAREDSFI